MLGGFLGLLRYGMGRRMDGEVVDVGMGNEAERSGGERRSGTGRGISLPTEIIEESSEGRSVSWSRLES